MMSADAIADAEQQLRSFYLLTYHLKDDLIHEASSTGVRRPTIEAAITANPALALLADLANLDKHGRLNNPRAAATSQRSTERTATQIWTCPAGDFVSSSSMRVGSSTAST